MKAEIKMNELMENQELLDRLANVQDAKEAVELLAAYGVEACESDVRQAMTAAGADGELNEDALDAVTGGLIKGPIYWVGYLIGKVVSKNNNACLPI